MEVARRFSDKGQLDKAIREYMRVVEDDPGDVRVWLKIGDLHVKKGAKREATETYLRVANFYGEQGFFLKAVAVYKQILKLNPRLVEVNLKLAELYRQLGLMSDAMQHFEMVAGHFHREGKTKEALATVRQLVELAPDNVATRIKLAELYSKEGMLDEAVAEFGTACDYLRVQEREDDFVKVGERLLWHKADNVPLSRELASIYLRRNDARRALQKLQACFKSNPRDVETLELLARAFQHLEQSAKTVSVLKEMARVLEEDGKHEQATEVYQRILRLAPGDRDALARVGQAAPGGSSSSASPKPPAPARRPSIPPPIPPRTRPLTVSMPAQSGPRISQPTGSVPLIDPDSRPEPRVTYSAPEPVNEDRSHSGAVREPSAGRSGAQPLPTDFADGAQYESSVAGEEHSEVIAKILTETDVYVKYRLHDKAIEHLRRVFELDPVNVEARERLKEILLLQGRRDEALGELMQLAELTAGYNRARATGYLREILAMDPAYRPALDLAHRSGIPIESVQGASTAEPTLTETPGVLEDSVEFVDIDIEVAEEPLRQSDTRIIAPRNSVLRAHGTPPSDDLSMDGPDTALMSLDDVELDGPETFMGADATVDHVGFAGESDTALVNATEILDFEQAEAEILGAEPVSDILDAFAPSAEAVPTRVMSTIDLDDDLAFDVDEFEVPFTMESADADLAEFYNQETRPGSESELKDGGGLDDDLDEADFFVAQGLYDSAREILHNVLATHPSHPLILAKLEEIDELERGSVHGRVAAKAPPTLPAPVLSGKRGGADDSTIDRMNSGHRKPSVMLQRPVEDEDADTHYDLGLAYKEMGLYEEAIQEFEKVLPVPSREVQCRLMMGLCYRENGDILSAINQFKAGLHAPSITLPEQLSLYYEIALGYETTVDDPHEALYFYELIQKRDRGYRDLQARIAACQQRAGHKEQKGGDRVSADIDAAVDSLLAEPDSHGRRSG